MNQDGKADVWTTPLSSPTQFTTQQSYVYCTPSLRMRQSESTNENPLTGLSDLSSIENALQVVTNSSSIVSFPKAAALLLRDKLSSSIINRSSIFTPSSSSAIMAAILKGSVGNLAGAFGHCLGRNSETAQESDWFERQSRVNSHRRNLEIVRIQLVKSGGALMLFFAEPFFCPFVAFAT